MTRLLAIIGSSPAVSNRPSDTRHDGVAVTVPGSLVGCFEDRGDLFAGQVAQDGLVKTFAGDGQHSLRDREGGGVANGRVAHEGADRDQPGVAGADAVAALAFDARGSPARAGRPGPPAVGPTGACRCVGR